MSANNSRRIEPGFRIVHAAIPESIFNHAKSQAALSGLKWPEFIAYVLLQHQSGSARRPSDPVQEGQMLLDTPPEEKRS